MGGNVVSRKIVPFNQSLMSFGIQFFNYVNAGKTAESPTIYLIPDCFIMLVKLQNPPPHSNRVAIAVALRYVWGCIVLYINNI